METLKATLEKNLTMKDRVVGALWDYASNTAGSEAFETLGVTDYDTLHDILGQFDRYVAANDDDDDLEKFADEAANEIIALIPLR